MCKSVTEKRRRSRLGTDKNSLAGDIRADCGWNQVNFPEMEAVKAVREGVRPHLFPVPEP